MTTKVSLRNCNQYQAMQVVLRATVALQCFGNWRWLTQLEETPLLHWMLNPVDIGGLAWSETSALATQQCVGWLVLLAGLVVLWRPNVFSLAPIVLLQTLITVAMWRLADGFAWEVSWLPVQLLTMFPFASQLLRIAAPAALLALAVGGTQQLADSISIRRIMNFLRWSTAVVFVAHGIEAVELNPKFVDLLIGANSRLFDVELPELLAQRILMGIGLLDIIVAVAFVSTKSRPVVLWIACWGLITALSRVIAHGWDLSWHESLTRAAHFGAPLAVALWWYLLESQNAKSKQSLDRASETTFANDASKQHRQATSTA